MYVVKLASNKHGMKITDSRITRKYFLAPNDIFDNSCNERVQEKAHGRR